MISRLKQALSGTTNQKPSLSVLKEKVVEQSIRVVSIRVNTCRYVSCRVVRLESCLRIEVEWCGDGVALPETSAM